MKNIIRQYHAAASDQYLIPPRDYGSQQLVTVAITWHFNETTFVGGEYVQANLQWAPDVDGDTPISINRMIYLDGTTSNTGYEEMVVPVFLKAGTPLRLTCAVGGAVGYCIQAGVVPLRGMEPEDL